MGMVTSHDVARAAGVSQPTVSRALRALPGIAPATIERVREVARQLGYIPSEAGRALSTQRTRAIGIVADELTNPFYPELVEPLRESLEQHGYRALLITDSAEAPLQLERLADGTLDGVILTTSTLHSSLPLSLAERGIPCVLAGRTVLDATIDSCAFDNSMGAQMAAEHLLSAGHRRVAVISGPIETSTGQEREQAFLEALAKHDASVDSDLIACGPFSFETGYRAVLAMFEASETPEPSPTAIFCGNDVIALGVCNALARLGRTDIAVVGFDDILAASWELFSLTTVRCDLAELAKESVRLLLARIEDPGRNAEQIRLPVDLVVRHSNRRA